VLSYSRRPKENADEDELVTSSNHFVIFDPRNLLACHDFKFIDLKPDPRNESCHASYRNGTAGGGGGDDTADFAERDGRWHHLAVTWSAADDGLTEVYMDGMRMATAYTRRTQPLEAGGALMLGGEQDCFGGCTDASQGFYGLMDEVRIWRVARSQADIARHMRWARGLEGHRDLVAYWKFNDPDEDGGQFRRHTAAVDSSGKGNDLALLVPPQRGDATVAPPGAQAGQSLATGTLEFKNNVAVSRRVKGFPEGDFTVEFWAKGEGVADDAGADAGGGGGSDSSRAQPERYAQLFSYAAERRGAVPGRTGGPDFMDDAIRIERYLEDFSGKLPSLRGRQTTRGAVSVHINSNENVDSAAGTSWLDFDAGWTDGGWHHVAVTFAHGDGSVQLFLDGAPRAAFWRNDRGVMDAKATADGGVEARLGAGTLRSGEGALALGQDQDCLGGCFSPSNAFSGQMAVVRVWSRALSQDDVRRNMFREAPESTEGLAALYVFDAAGVASTALAPVALDRSGNKNHLELRSNPPQWVYSTAPLTEPDGAPVPPPTPGAAGYALALHDRQVLMLPSFDDFPAEAITVEFWMNSIDTCRPGVPFSYAHGRYEHEDNSFLIFNYNSFGVSVMEDEGTLADHLSGVSATDGTWHHVAVTWESASGLATLYDNGRPVWRAVRAKGKRIPSGGTLVVGREQDCQGGCFDSARGASGSSSVVEDQEYGPQDFFGQIEEMRVWRVARTAEQIAGSMAADDGRGAPGGSRGGFDAPGVRPDDPDLVAYWKFDEGAGFTIRDVTGRGHDLQASAPPNWEVVRWLSTCGNGRVEGGEQCDDGNLTDGDGCGGGCVVERGWSCDAGSPSVCAKGGRRAAGGADEAAAGAGGRGSSGRGGASGGGGGSGGSGGGGGGGGGGAFASVVAGLVVPAFVVAMGVGIFAYRDAVYEAFPQAGAAAGAVAAAASRVVPEGAAKAVRSFVGGFVPERFGGSAGSLGGGGGAGGGYALALDPEELDMSPEFLSPTPARPPGAAGAYQPLGGGGG